jgi:hypothetical protein
MCLGTLEVTSAGVELCAFGVAHSVAQNARWTAEVACLCLGEVDQELLDFAFDRLLEGLHPEEVELKITERDPRAPARQWLLGTGRFGCHAWCGTRCSGYRAARASDDARRAAKVNWGARPTVVSPFLSQPSRTTGHRERVTALIVEAGLLIPVRSAVWLSPSDQRRGAIAP